MTGELIDLVIEVAGDIREQEGLDTSTPITSSTTLFGEEGLFDSMGLVSLIVAIEQAVDERLGARIALADEKALSQKTSPYRTVTTLAEYAAGQIPG